MSTTRKIKAQSIDGVSFQLNYMEQATANDKITLWNRFLDTAASRPEDGTGGSPSANVTWTRTTSDPIQGEGSFLYSKLNGVNTQGEGVSYDITIPSGQQARVQTVKFDYRIASGTFSGGSSSTDSDLIVYMYRTTATGRLIEPSVIKLDGAVVGVNYSYQGEFQTDSDATGYRFIIYSATTSTSNFTVQFDNFYVGPSKNVTGDITTAWQSYTPTGSWVTNTTYTGKWRRLGDSMELLVDIATTGAPTATNLTFTIPSGHTIDTTKLASGTSNQQPLGFATYSDDNGTTVYGPSTVKYNDTTSLRCVYSSVASNSESGVSNTAPFTWGNTDSAKINVFKLPIVGWGATATLGQDADTRVVAMRAQAATPTGPTDGSGPVVYGTAPIFDTHGAYSTSTGRYTVPVGGYFLVSASVNLTGTEAVNQYIDLGVYKNATIQQNNRTRLQSTSLDDSMASVVCLVQANAGDLLDVRVGTNITGVAYNANANNNFIQITRMSGPSQIAASEDVSAMVTTSNTTIAASGGTALQFSVTEYDTHGSITLNDGGYTTFKAPYNGLYQVSSHYAPSSAITPSAIGNLAAIRLAKSTASTTSVKHLGQFVAQQTSGGIFFELNGDSNIKLLSGEKINLYIQNGLNASTWTGANTTTSTWFSIVKVG